MSSSKGLNNHSDEKILEETVFSGSETNYVHDASTNNGHQLKRTLKNRHIAMIRCVQLNLPVAASSHSSLVLAVSSALVFS